MPNQYQHTRYGNVDVKDFKRRSETFGFDSPDPWALWALRLLFNMPRAYTPIVEAWEEAHPGTKSALRKLVTESWVSYQEAVVVDLSTGRPAKKTGRPLDRYLLTAKGKRLLNDHYDDPVGLCSRWEKLSAQNAPGVLSLLEAFELENSHAKYGLSVPHATKLTSLAPRTARWWISRLTEEKLIRQLDEQWADAREVVPAHWRIKRELCRQLQDVFSAYPKPWGYLRGQWTLSKSRFLKDINPARLGISGATDFDHDIEAQKLCAALLQSPRAALDAPFEIEPKYNLPAKVDSFPYVFRGEGGVVGYQPDAIMTSLDENGRQRRIIVEYERYQSRRDAWGHIQRFCGWVDSILLPFESATLCFVVDSEARLRGYVELIEAYADWVEDTPSQHVQNPLTLTASCLGRVYAQPDPLEPKAWYRVELTPGTNEKLVVHDPDNSPYDEYFSKKGRIV